MVDCSPGRLNWILKPARLKGLHFCVISRAISMQNVAPMTLVIRGFGIAVTLIEFVSLQARLQIVNIISNHTYYNIFYCICVYTV